jgi:hypothetical protein
MSKRNGRIQSFSYSQNVNPTFAGRRMSGKVLVLAFSASRENQFLTKNVSSQSRFDFYLQVMRAVVTRFDELAEQVAEHRGKY